MTVEYGQNSLGWEKLVLGPGEVAHFDALGKPVESGGILAVGRFGDTLVAAYFPQKGVKIRLRRPSDTHGPSGIWRRSVSACPFVAEVPGGVAEFAWEAKMRNSWRHLANQAGLMPYWWPLW